ncbi:MAG: hypothetical protein HW387_1026, partial [Parachlamydiales bacterium]|nr:hypothetical protein [Parachlamydiales bacterium]
LVPSNNGAAFGLITRYDTSQSLTTAASYTCFDTTAVSNASMGFAGGVFDGRYVYLVPNDSGASGTITRYDTTSSFLAATSYTCFDTAAVSNASRGFFGGVFDGRYVYLVPNNNGSAFGTITRYDTTLSFFAAGSYTCFDTATVNANSTGFHGAVFDGRYVYLVPNINTVLTRLDAYPGPQATAMAASQAPDGFAIGTYAGTATPTNGLIVSGNVGIGTASPQYTLDINGTLRASAITQSTSITVVSYNTMTTNNQMVTLFEGYTQGGYGGGMVGTNKQMSAESTTCFDLLAVNGALKGFQGGVFDGRYIYLVPYTNSSSLPSGRITRYDTTLPFYASGSYTAFDTVTINSSSKGFSGGVFDGRYVYLVPNNNGAAFGQITRYDTTLSFLLANSYTCFNTTTVNSNSKGFQGGVFDGRYIYLVPSNNGAIFGQITRYDTTASFITAASYAIFNTTTGSASSKGFQGGVFDGRYVYLVPLNNGSPFGTITRYDTTATFTTAGSYAFFNTTTVNANSKGFVGGVFDGRYVYLVPNNNGAAFGLITRYDTTQPFTTAASYTCFDTLAVHLNSKGFMGGLFDGRYVYLVPNSQTGVEFGQVTRYDTTQSFNAVSSYTTFDTTTVETASRGFVGAVFDGRYVYLVPGVNPPVLTRLDAYPGPQATAIAASQSTDGFVIGAYVGINTPPTNGLIVSGNVGIGTSNPAYTLDVNGVINATTVSATMAVLPLTGTTINNQLTVLSQGYSQGGFGGGSVGTNKQMSANSTTCFNLLAVNAALYGFQGGVFDGRYIYLVPNSNGSPFGQITRYDTTLPFYATGSYTAFNTATINASSKGFYGGVFDGRYVYLVPYDNGAKFGQITRFDTTQSFNTADSYTYFDTTAVSNASMGFQGAVFDGRYVYLVPSNNGAAHGTITRYDTTASFTTAASYTCFDTTAVSDSSKGFVGGVFDGRYVYLVPNDSGGSGTITRYDTTSSFLAAGSYTCFGTTAVNSASKGFAGGVFDGRYVYLVPNNNGTSFGQITRYDTTQSFTAAASYSYFDTTTVKATSKGFMGGLFDGRYVYLVPNSQTGVDFGQVTRYDTTQSFNAVSSYTTFDTTTVAANSKGFVGGVFDGRYVYLVPSTNSFMTRLDAYPGPQASAIAASQSSDGFAIGAYAGTSASPANGLIVSGNVGIGTSNPLYTLDVNGTINSTALLSGNFLGTTANNQLTVLSQGYTQGGFGGGSVGTNKQMSANSTTCFDLAAVNAALSGFTGGVFDGRYVYLVPNTAGGADGRIARYDTTLPFYATSSYTVFNTKTVNVISGGFRGGVFDGRYVYLIPDNSGGSGQITRYDTTLSFVGAGSYTCFNTLTVNAASKGFFGGVFDGRYVYLVPNNNGAAFGQITRYDIAQSFTTAASYTCFNTLTVNAASLGFKGGVFDGRYVYLVPNSNGQITRYDIAQSFTTAASYTCFDTQTVNNASLGFFGGVFDGRYVYLVPNDNGASGTITRYDIAQSFTTAASYTCFDTTAVNNASKGFVGGVFDGRYVYLVPNNNGAAFGTITRYDTTLSFLAAGSYTCFGSTTVNANSKGFQGAVFDGRYVYLVPNTNTVLTRIDAYPGPQATAMAASQAPNGFAIGTYAGVAVPPDGSLIVSGNVGIGLTAPTFSLHLALDSAGQPTFTTWTNNSDVRIKQNIQDISGALSIIRQLQPRQFTYHPDYAIDVGVDVNSNFCGFVADEVETVLDGCVSDSGTCCRGGGRDPIAGMENLKCLNIHNVLVYGIQAVKELADIVNQLQQQINDRKNR